VLVITGAQIGAIGLLWMFVNAALNVAYGIFLLRGYRAGDLSVVYPLARGTGPVLALVGAILLFGERPTPLAIAGAIAIVAGVLALTGDPRKLRQRGVGIAVAYALLTGVTIAAYTLWDKRAVSVLLIPPIVYEWGANVFRAIILTPQALPRWAEVRAEWASRANRTAALAVASLSPLAYMLVLTALAISPVSYVAPAREIGILFGVLMGARSLAEADIGRRSIAAVLMVGGVIALALG
jgi:drug/metabolite transporter (DMT)-like permease